MAKYFWRGALLFAVLPLFSQAPPNKKTQELLRFTLNEGPDRIVSLIGPPARIDDAVPGYQSWQYEFAPDEQSDDNSPPAWLICLRTRNREIVSVTRNFDRPQEVDDLFPPAETTVHYWPSESAAKFSLRLRPLSGETLLLAIGTERPGDRTTQLVLIRRSALRTFMPWLAEQLL
ncbi:MAG: hypothetical protein C5B51_07195 [Terriglobia bacterium]|nr:MAG: hypothetical protein C5B51_07195 [Terriglobia bacterium]